MGGKSFVETAMFDHMGPFVVSDWRKENRVKICWTRMVEGAFVRGRVNGELQVRLDMELVLDGKCGERLVDVENREEEEIKCQLVAVPPARKDE
jgi:hypothetical protein